jgi:hypothetical protein
MADLFSDESWSALSPQRRQTRRLRIACGRGISGNRRAGTSDRCRRCDRANGLGRQAVVDDPLGASGHRQDQHRPPSRECSRPALRAHFSGVLGVADLKKIFAEAKTAARAGQRTLLFVDEIHRFNRAQQDGFLPYVEDGTVTLVGATTETPASN